MGRTSAAGAERGAMTDAVRSDRDLTLDLVRVLCLLIVVAAHVTFVALRPGPDGSPQNFLPMQELQFFAELAWFAQPMPLFFVVGGFASLTGWRSAQRRGEDGWMFFRARLIRLVRPAAGFLLIITTVVWIPVLLGVPRALGDAALHGIGLPLWFIGAYLLCQAAVPFLAEQHRRHPLRTLAVLFAGAVVTDAVRLIMDNPMAGLPNYLFVWPLIQQLGFLLADGWFDHGPANASRPFGLHRWQMIIGVVISFVLVAATGTLLPYGGDMLQNQIPPTLPLIMIALGHTLLLRLLHEPLTRLMERKGAQLAVFVVGSRAMTLYLWHVPFVVAIAALFFFVPGYPQPPGTGWWWTRPVVFLLVLGLVFLVSLGVARWERGPAPERLRQLDTPVARGRLVLAGLLAVTLPYATVITSLDTAVILLGTAAMVLACLLVTRIGPRAQK
ncbi:acyltransferase family protein [Propionibacteriaceae bacterium Y1700]|uniref:acyltransferase family protein n=1 Tax=Microlunatus sp. Y1700 TaxID=3418487 RepID=UPI003DA6D8C8